MIRQPALSRHQQGVSLLTVMVVLLLALLLTLGSARLSVLNERISGNSSDYQRAYEAAEALLKDAEIDISCLNASTQTPCANRAAVTNLTCNVQLHADLITTLQTFTPPCRDGICADLGTQTNGDPATSFWNNDTTWATFVADGVGASFGEYTTGQPSATDTVNPLLQQGEARYWIELLPYGSSEGGRSVASETSFANDTVFKPDTSNCPIIFRVTAAARGLRPGTTVVLQSVHLFR